MKNVAYLLALSAGMLTLSGCDWFGCGKKSDDMAAEKAMAANEATPSEATNVASAEGMEQSATEQKIEEAPVATAEADTTMPMNPVEEKAA